MKTFKCYSCKEDLPEDKFNRNAPSPGRSNRTVQNSCKVCHAAYKRKWRRDNPEKYRADKTRDQRLRRARIYGLTPADVDAMAAKQDSKCLICGDQTDLVIDHCHATKIVRGMICGPCNLGLGKFRDNSDALRRAADYLDRAPRAVL